MPANIREKSHLKISEYICECGFYFWVSMQFQKDELNCPYCEKKALLNEDNIKIKPL